MEQIKAAEDILSLTRTLKETWLFGKLQTIGTSEAETRAQTAAAKVADGLKKPDSAASLNVERTNGVDEHSSGAKMDRADGEAQAQIGEMENGNNTAEDEQIT